MPTWRSVEQQICPPFKKIAGKWREVLIWKRSFTETGPLQLKVVFNWLKSTLS